MGLLFDSTRCIGCGACAQACKTANRLPEPIEEVPTANTWTVVREVKGVWVRHLCMHCLTPTCVSVCPVGAIERTPEGPVVYDAARCIGCRYCIQACPFNVPKYQWDSPLPIMGKCIMCVDRVRAGSPTACAEACPTGATLFGERASLVEEARSRLAKDPGSYSGEIYGLEEAGGTSVLMLAGVPFAELGFKTRIPHEELPVLTWDVLSKVPDFVVLAGACLFGIHWITHRREDVRAREAHAAAAPVATGAARRAQGPTLGSAVARGAPPSPPPRPGASSGLSSTEVAGSEGADR